MEKNSANILLLCGNLSYAGAQRQLFELAKGLNDKHKITVCSITSDMLMLEEFEKNNIKVVCLNKRFRNLISIFVLLNKLIKKNQIDVIYSFLFQANTFSRLLKLSNKNIKIIASERSSNTVISFNKKIIEKLLIPFTDLYIANSYAGKDNLINKYSISADKIKVVHNGIDLLRFERTYKDKLNCFENDNIVIVMVGRIKPDKNYEMLLEVAEKVCSSNKKVIFFIVGDHSKTNISYYNEIILKHKKIKNRGQIKFIGARSDVPGILANADISILTSHREGCSNTVLESMFSKCPLVLTDVGDNKIMVSDENKPYIVEPGDVEGMVNKISELIESEKLRELIGSANYIKASNNFTVDKMVDKTERIMYDLLDDIK